MRGWRVVVVLAAAGCGGRTRGQPDAGPDEGDAAEDGGPDAATCPLLCVPVDHDGDGHGALGCGDDCDDWLADVFPGAADSVGDGVDQDCDGTDGIDHDHDGHIAVQAGGDDCDDESATVHPGGNDGAGLSVESMPSGGTADRLAVEPNGVAHVVFASGESCRGKLEDPDGGRMLLHATNRGGPWIIETVDTLCVPAGFSMALDPLGAVHVAYTRSACLGSACRSAVLYATNRTGAWEVEVVDDEGLDPSQFPSIAVDPCGVAHILYGTNSEEETSPVEEYRYATNRSGRWTRSLVAEGANGWCSLAADGQGDLSAVLVLDSGLAYANNQADAWPTEIVQASDGHCLVQTSLVVDSTDRPSVAYAGELMGFRLATRREDGQWAAVTIDADAHPDCLYFRGGSALALDPRGASHVVYLHEDHAIWYATNRGGEWATRPLAVGFYPAIAVDRTGARHFVSGRAYGTISDPGDGIDQNCDGVDGVDADQDRHASRDTGGDDPDDADPSVP